MTSPETVRSLVEENEATARRAFLGRIGKAAVTAPAIALLLAASSSPAAAQYRPASGEEQAGWGGEVQGRGR